MSGAGCIPHAVPHSECYGAEVIGGASVPMLLTEAVNRFRPRTATRQVTDPPVPLWLSTKSCWKVDQGAPMYCWVWPRQSTSEGSFAVRA